jgi:rRNA maturation endonuclease Nob1
VRRGPQPSQRPQNYSTVSAAIGDDPDDEDTRSVITDVTAATITPSESASAIFHNPFNLLQPPSSSGSSTPRSTLTNHKLSTFEDESIAVASQLSVASTAKATLDTPPPPSIIATESLVSERSSATKDWSTQSDDEDSPVLPSIQHSPESSRLFISESFQTLELSDDDNDDNDDGEGRWITPANIKKHKIRDSTTTNYVVSSTSGTIYPPNPPRRRSDVSERASRPVMKSACMTGDFAMQNVALQMGLNLISMDGESVRHVKTFVLRCHGCFTYFSTLLSILG